MRRTGYSPGMSTCRTSSFRGLKNSALKFRRNGWLEGKCTGWPKRTGCTTRKSSKDSGSGKPYRMEGSCTFRRSMFPAKRKFSSCSRSSSWPPVANCT
jgi:hypothetical protein